MGSLITALQNQNIAAANQETLGDIYAANPQNLGYTENPFGYTASPAVIQTAYPKYGYNATAPMVPPSYEDYDLTTLFSMLGSMQAPQQDGQPQSFGGPITAPSFRSDGSRVSGGVEPMVLPMPTPGMDMIPHMPGGQPPKTPAGILAQLAGEVQLEKGQPTPVPGAYTVPDAVTPPSKEEQKADQAAEDKRIQDMIAEDAKRRQRAALEQQYQRTFAGLVSGPPPGSLSNAEITRLIQNPELITGSE